MFVFFFKAKDDLQTEADRSAQKCIIASLSQQFPKIKIIGEEGQLDLTSIPSDWVVTNGDSFFLKENKSCNDALAAIVEDDLVIWVDPLDGTAEFTQGFLEHVTVLIGISLKDQAIGGIIHQPYFKNENHTSGRTIWGLQGLGCGGFIPVSPSADKFIVTTTRSHCTELVQAALNALTPTNILRVGGAGYKVLQLLEGKAHAYVFASPGCKKWDTCAPEAVLEAAGGVLTDISGVHYKYGKDVKFPNREGVLATAAGTDHASIVNKIPDDLKQSLR